MTKMLSVDEALDHILKDAVALETETVPLTACTGRIAASDITANITQPPFAASAMDGYAVRAGDIAKGAVLNLIGEAPAGFPFQREVGPGETVRVYTGAAIPDGADHVVVQENVIREGETIRLAAGNFSSRHIRDAGIDFTQGDTLCTAGTELNEIHGSLLAAANIAAVPVVRCPVIALFSNGDELVDPGSQLARGQIVDANHYALSALIKRWGGEPNYLGRAGDTKTSVQELLEAAAGSDLIVPIGGASVGDFDVVKPALLEAGGDIVFEKVAVRPGKPTWFGKFGEARVIGLPGNPASAVVTSSLFVQALVRRLSGASSTKVFTPATLTQPLETNGAREHFMRAVRQPGQSGLTVSPSDNQDSSLLSPLASANALIRRMPHVPAAKSGDIVQTLAIY